MTDHYSISIDDGLVDIRFAARPTRDDLLRTFDEIDDPERNRYRLWDFSEAGIDLSREELRSIAADARKKLGHPATVATVVPDDLSFGVSRIYEVFREHPEVTVKTFRSRHAAIEWLNEARDR